MIMIKQEFHSYLQKPISPRAFKTQTHEGSKVNAPSDSGTADGGTGREGGRREIQR